MNQAFTYPPNNNPENNFLDMAIHFGDTICRDFQRGGQREEFSNYRVYDGLSGIALFLCELYQQTGKPYYKEITIQTLDLAWTYRDEPFSDPYKILGFYNGLSGFAYTLILVGRKMHHGIFVKHGLQLIDRLFGHDRKYFSADITNGIAGAIPALIKIYASYPNTKLKSFLLQLGQQLFDSAQKEKIGWSWTTMSKTQKNLTGYSHGVAGIVTSLFELHLFTGNIDFQRAAYQGLKYEQYYYNPKYKNWPDFRSLTSDGISKEPSFPSYWCHGAPGIILSRIRCYEITNDKKIFEDLYPGIDSTVEASYYHQQSNSSLCHGVLGNCDILLYAGTALNYPGLIAHSKKRGKEGIQIFHQQSLPWINGYGDTEQEPGLMMGLAGMGYAYLRLWDPLNVPLILLIHPGDPF